MKRNDKFHFPISKKAERLNFAELSEAVQPLRLEPLRMIGEPDEELRAKVKEILVKQMELLYQHSEECSHGDRELADLSNSMGNLMQIALTI